MSAPLYSLRNYLAIPFHYALTSGIAVGAYMIGQPWAIGIASTATIGLIAPILWLNNEVLGKHMQAHPNVHPYSPHLGIIVRDLFKASGLKAEKLVVYSFTPTKYGSNPYAEDEEIAFGKIRRRVRAGRQYYRDQRMQQEEEEENLPRLQKWKRQVVESFKDNLRAQKYVLNAAAIRLAKPVIMISDPLLKLLNHEEEKAVLAHEFAHAAAHHVTLSIPIKILNGISRTTSTLTRLAAAFSVGLWAYLGTVTGLIGLSFVVSRIQGDKKQKEEDRDLTIPELSTKKNLEWERKCIMSTMALSAFSLQNPAYASIWLASITINLSSQFISGSLSRSKEYQADRGATILGASPLALMTSLRKISFVYNQSIKMASAWDGLPSRQPHPLRKIWSRAISTHPTLENRLERLVDIARKSGYSEVAIENAHKGPLKIENYEDIPLEVIREAMSHFVEKQESTAPKSHLVMV